MQQENNVGAPAADHEQTFQQVLDNLRENHQSYFESRATPQFGVDQTADHPNSRIARLRVKWEHGERMLFLKLLYPDQVDGRTNRSDREYKEQQIRAEYEVLKKLDRAFAGHQTLGVIKPVACFPEHLALVTEEQPGIKFSSIIGNVKIFSKREEIKEVVQWVQLCGSWLRHFQTFVPGNGKFVEFSFDEILDFCEVRLGLLTQFRQGEFTNSFCQSIRHFLREQVEQTKQETMEIIGRHNDFGPYNMILTGQKLVLLDFAGFGFGPSCWDYVKFWCGLDQIRGSLLVSDKTVDQLQEAFISGYGKMLDPNTPLFAIYRLGYILDQMGDIWQDWSTIDWKRRPLYKQLYRRYLAWLRAHC